MNQEQFKEFYDQENLKFQSDLYELLYENLPVDVVTGIKHQELISSHGTPDFKFRGYNKIYNNRIGRRFIMNDEGKWFYTPDTMGWWTNLGYEVTNNTFQEFVDEIKADLDKEGAKNE